MVSLKNLFYFIIWNIFVISKIFSIKNIKKLFLYSPVTMLWFYVAILYQILNSGWSFEWLLDNFDVIHEAIYTRWGLKKCIIFQKKLKNSQESSKFLENATICFKISLKFLNLLKNSQKKLKFTQFWLKMFMKCLYITKKIHSKPFEFTQKFWLSKNCWIIMPKNLQKCCKIIKLAQKYWARGFSISKIVDFFSKHF